MKIRIKDNSLRLRLSQSEVQQLKDTGLVRAVIQFGPVQGATLIYEVRAIAHANITATYQQHRISIQIPESQIKDWADSNTVSIRSEQQISEETQLSILVEKDFKCLTDRPGENEVDLFPHPKEGEVAC